MIDTPQEIPVLVTKEELLANFVQSAKKAVEAELQMDGGVQTMCGVVSMYTPEGEPSITPVIHLFRLPSTEEEVAGLIRRTTTQMKAFGVLTSSSAWMVVSRPGEVSSQNLKVVYDLARQGRLEEHPLAVRSVVVRMESHEECVVWTAPIEGDEGDLKIGTWSVINKSEPGGHMTSLLPPLPEGGLD